MNNIINIQHMTGGQRGAILKILVEEQKIPFKILIEPDNNKDDDMIMTGFEFKTMELATEIKMKYF